MKVSPTALLGLLILEPNVFSDARGFFLESYNERIHVAGGYCRPLCPGQSLVFGTRNVVRGLHYQVGPQGKLIERVPVGEILDVAVDLRRSSPTFGEWYAASIFRIRINKCYGFRRVSPTVSAFCPKVLTCSTRPLTSMIQRRSARLHGTILTLKIDWQLSDPPIIVSAKDKPWAFRFAKQKYLPEAFRDAMSLAVNVGACK